MSWAPERERLRSHRLVRGHRDADSWASRGSPCRKCRRTRRNGRTRWSSWRMHRSPIGSFVWWIPTDARNSRESSPWSCWSCGTISVKRLWPSGGPWGSGSWAPSRTAAQADRPSLLRFGDRSGGGGFGWSRFRSLPGVLMISNGCERIRFGTKFRLFSLNAENAAHGFQPENFQRLHEAILVSAVYCRQCPHLVYHFKAVCSPWRIFNWIVVSCNLQLFA